ncbi:glycolate oxidase subunit GlcE [Roseibium algae]|uniref:Glycolate oxidase subunit GlcE n=1 Tax=Roseibium algae TaxID=3123038 RepID=A0ABU8THF0_9HYPH
MDATFKPRDTRETCEAVKWAVAEEQPLEIVGTRSKQALGRPVQAAQVLDLSGLSGIVAYEPDELVLTLKAGTPIAEVEALVASSGQELSFEPMDYGPLLGQESGKGTIGGVLAANLAGPRRIKYGAARDHILGMEAVSGRGEVFNSGGKVVKNVTGYDLPRALCGSWGTLAVATTVTVKVNPRPETSATLALAGLTDTQAIEAMCMAMGSSAEVSGAAHLPSGRQGEGALTVLRLEGFATSVEYRFDSLGKVLAGLGSAERIEEAASQKLWGDIRDCAPIASGQDPVWRISVAPTVGAKLVEALQALFAVEAYYDWSGGLVWLKCLDGVLHDTEVRSVIAQCGGGHATLVRADASKRSSVPVFQPQPAPLAALAKRLKHQFDPIGILNPGRMTAGV